MQIQCRFVMQNDSVIERDVKKIRSTDSITLYLIGDINFIHTDWLTFMIKCSYEKAVSRECKNLNVCNCNLMEAHWTSFLVLTLIFVAKCKC